MDRKECVLTKTGLEMNLNDMSREGIDGFYKNNESESFVRNILSNGIQMDAVIDICWFYNGAGKGIQGIADVLKIMSFVAGWSICS